MRPIRTAKLLVLTVALLVAGCSFSGDGVDTTDQRALLDEALTAASDQMGTPAPELATSECDELARSGRQRWEGSSRADLPAADRAADLEALKVTWEHLGFDVEVRTLADGSEPALYGTAGDVRVSVTVSGAFDGKVRVAATGSTTCAGS